MDQMAKTHELENKLTKVQTDVSYLKKKMDKVEIKLDSMDDKTDRLMSELPGVFKDIMENYISRAEFTSFQGTVLDEIKEHKVFDKRLDELETRNKVITAVFSVALFILSFGETIAKWLNNLVHQP